MSHINRKSFLAEMRSLLAFMDSEDRARVLRRYEAMFDAAGPDGEEALIKSLGSPVRQVLQVEREYRQAQEEGKIPFQDAETLPAEPEGESAPAFEEVFPAAGEAPLPVPAGAEAETATAAGPEPADLPAAPAPESELPAEIPAPEPIRAAENRPVPAPERELDEEEIDEEEDEEGGPGAGRVIAALLVTIPMLAVWAVLFGFFLAVGLAVLAAGVAIGAAGVYLGNYALSGTITFMPDILMVGGGALVCFCLALLLAWTGLWIAIGGCIVTVRLTGAIYRGILGKKKEE